jgi:hypothetical protein
MHSTVTVRDGIFRATRFAADDDPPVDREEWRRWIDPAIVLLKVLGGGSMLLPHNDR